MSVCCECCASPGRGLCDGLNTRPEESFRVRVCLNMIEKPHRKWPRPTTAAQPWNIYIYIYIYIYEVAELT